MASTLTRKSWRELTHRKARALFTIATIAAAVTGLWLFAVPQLIDDAMHERIESDLLWDVRLSPNGIALTDADIAAIRDLPNVAAVEARVTTSTDFLSVDRTGRAWLIGVDDFAGQEVNAVRLLEGELPPPGHVLTDPQNARTGRYLGGVGDEVVLGSHRTTVSGVATSLEFSATVDDADPVFYLPLDRLQAAMGYAAINWIDLRVDDHDPAAMAATAEVVQAHLRGLDPEITYWRVLETRAPGDWPEKESFDNVIRLTYVIAALGLLSALLMVYTTMSTVVREQTREIGIMKAVGGSRRAITRSYLLVALLLGGAGTMLGIVAGVFLSNLLVGFAGRQFSGIEAGFGLPLWVLALSLVVGLGATMLAALPAIRRATGRPVREAIVDHGVASSFGSGALDAFVERARFLPRSFRFGLRNTARQKTRSAVTGAQIGFAVGTFLGFLALGITVQDVAAGTVDAEGGDIKVSGAPDAAEVLAGVPGVDAVIPVYYTDVGIAGTSYPLQGQTPPAVALHDELEAGRWFTEDEEAGAGLVTVLGPALAKTLGAEVGDVVTADTMAGTPLPLEVVGIDSIMVNDGNMLYTPVSTAALSGDGVAPTTYYVLTADSADSFVDRVAAQIQGALARTEIRANIEVRYVEREATLSSNRTILALLMILGIPVIAIGMIGLVNTMTMNVIERTREIGILRSIGARARHIRRMIRAEALILSVLGWVAAIPIGYAVGSLLTWLLSDGFGVDFTLRFPMWPLPVALAATLVLATLVVRLPVRRAVRLRPGTALRYE